MATAVAYAMPWKEDPVNRKVHELQMRLLKVNSELRLKQLYCEKLEYLLHQRNERVDQLYSLLERAHTINRRLEAECEHLAHLIAASPNNVSIPATN